MYIIENVFLKNDVQWSKFWRYLSPNLTIWKDSSLQTNVATEEALHFVEKILGSGGVLELCCYINFSSTCIFTNINVFRIKGQRNNDVLVQ